jgi:hypothetical protein
LNDSRFQRILFEIVGDMTVLHSGSVVATTVSRSPPVPMWSRIGSLNCCASEADRPKGPTSVAFLSSSRSLSFLAGRNCSVLHSDMNVSRMYTSKHLDWALWRSSFWGLEGYRSETAAKLNCTYICICRSSIDISTDPCDRFLQLGWMTCASLPKSQNGRIPEKRRSSSRFDWMVASDCKLLLFDGRNNHFLENAIIFCDLIERRFFVNIILLKRISVNSDFDRGSIFRCKHKISFTRSQRSHQQRSNPDRCGYVLWDIFPFLGGRSDPGQIRQNFNFLTIPWWI